MKKKYTAAVIGCGRVGAEEWNYSKDVQPETHAASYKNNARINLAGLADINREKLKNAGKYFPEVALFNSAEDMFLKIKPDIVSIATNSDTHASLVKLAAKYKIPAILCEKPIAESVKQAEGMIKKCKESKSMLFINHQRRFDPLLQRWQKKIKNGLIGNIIQVNCYYYNGLLNSGTHVIDLLRFFLGEVDWVKGFVNTQTSWKKNDDNIDGLIKFKNGTLATLQTLPKNYGLSDFHFYGERGYFAVKNLGYEIEYRKVIENKYCKGFYQLSENAEIEGKPRSLASSAVSHMVSCLDGKMNPVSMGEDGLAALRVIFALRESAKKQGKIIRIKI